MGALERRDLIEDPKGFVKRSKESDQEKKGYLSITKAKNMKARSVNSQLIDREIVTSTDSQAR